MRTPGRPRLRHRARASRIAALLMTALLLAPAVAVPVAVGAPRGPFTPHAHRTVTHSHIASAAVAAKSAAKSPRQAHVAHVPRPTVKIAHPAKAANLRGTKTIAPKAQIVAPPDLDLATQFAGLAEADTGGYYPPDPWVSANSTYVVQIVNAIVRISNRSGATLQTMPAWLLFGLTADQFHSDGRIIWDATHGRWLGVGLSFNETVDSNYLNFIVSDTADPTAGWSTYAFSFGTDLPDFPSIASSTDKIVLTDNLFHNGGDTYAGSEILTIGWAVVLGGATVYANDCVDSTAFSPRAAQVLTPATDVHLIELDTSDGEQIYTRIIGTGRCDDVLYQFVDVTDLGQAFVEPPDPRQNPSDTIGTNNSAVDGRPTDAIWANNRLYWVSTYPVTYDGGVTFNDGVVIWQATTAAISGAASPGEPQIISAGDGTDDYMGGIGLMRNGTVVVIYSESSNTDPISMWVNQLTSGGTLGTPVQVDVSDATYASERWGDFAGVATDPTGSASVWATHEVAAEDGTWRTDVVRVVADNDLPSAPGVPTAAIVPPTQLVPTAPVRVSWAASTDVSTNVVGYDVAQSINSGPFLDVGRVSSTSIVRPLLINVHYQFEIRAVDAAGNVGAWRVSSSLTPGLTQSTSSTAVTGTWGSSASSSFSGGSTRYSSKAGSTATFTASAARSIAIVATRATSRGSFKVYVDGVYKATVSTYGSPTAYRRVFYAYTWATPGTHKIKIVIVGTSGHPRVDLDAFVVLR